MMKLDHLGAGSRSAFDLTECARRVKWMLPVREFWDTEGQTLAVPVGTLKTCNLHHGRMLATLVRPGMLATHLGATGFDMVGWI